MIDVILIHANWCGHCQTLMPEWKKMKEIIKNDKNIHVHEIESSDADKDHRIDEFNKKTKGGRKITVPGFPTIVRLENGDISEYKGERTAEKLAKWARKEKMAGGKRKSQHKKRKIGGKKRGD
jgi:thiol-disulfide isomerase/thioredoxin